MQKLVRLVLGAVALLPAAFAADQSARAFTADDTSRARGMLRIAREEVEKYFYDPQRLGDKFSQDCAAAEKALATARSNDEALMIIAQVFLNIGDSHTRFYPPARKDRVRHPWKFHAVGDAVYISEVERGSEAEQRGLRVGDRLHGLDGMAVSRTNRSLMQYMVYGLAPRAGMTLLVQAPGQEPRSVTIMGALKTGSGFRDLRNELDYYEMVLESEKEDARRKSRFVELPGDILVWKLRVFDNEKTAAGLRKAAAAKTLILDLRGNPGGYVNTLERTFDHFFADDFEAYTRRERTKAKTIKVHGKARFKGLLLVLVDQSSASASEILARTVQMKQRGILLGDRTAGMVSVARVHPIALGSAERFTGFYVGITISDLVMADGSVIEDKGVMPDFRIIPTHEQLYQGQDPVLAKALELAGHKLGPAEAGKLFPPLD